MPPPLEASAVAGAPSFSPESARVDAHDDRPLSDADFVAVSKQSSKYAIESLKPWIEQTIAKAKVPARNGPPKFKSGFKTSEFFFGCVEVVIGLWFVYGPPEGSGDTFRMLGVGMITHGIGHFIGQRNGTKNGRGEAVIALDDD